jgi:hypothetical protein
MTNNKKTLMWTMTADVALGFYKRCMERNATTPEEKYEILAELAQEGKITNIMATGRTPDEVAKDLSKNFGNVLHIKARKKHNEHEN